jgi:hypothetical protein
MIAGALYVALGALAWRVRGGGLVPLGSTHAARAVAGVALAAPLAWWCADAWLLLLAPAVWLGLVLVGWGDWMDMRPGRANELVAPLVSWLRPGITQDVAGMSLTGLVLVAPPAIVLVALGHAGWLLVGPALALGPIYYAGWRISPVHGTETAEWLAGAAIAAGLAAAIAA